MKIDLSMVEFPADSHWQAVLCFLENNQFGELKALCPVEFCVKLQHSFPYEWSYWKKTEDFELIILHKGKYKQQIIDGFLQNLDKSHEYIFGNSVFLVYIRHDIDKKEQLGDPNHNYLITISHFIGSKFLKFKKRVASMGHGLFIGAVGDKISHSGKQTQIKNILLVTANNCGNVGDDAITFAAKFLLQKAFPKSQIMIDQLPCHKKKLIGYDLVVLGGGGILYDHNFYNVQNYCQYILYAHSLGIKSAVIGVGAQDIYTERGIELYKRALDLCEFVAVRDKLSYQILKERVKIKSPLYLNRDVVFAAEELPNKEATKKGNSKPILLYSLLDPAAIPFRPGESAYRLHHDNCFRYLAEHFDLRLLVQSKDDLVFYQELKKQYPCQIIRVPYEESNQVVNLYRQADLIMTSRLHGYIFAALAQVPVICVTFDNPGTKLAGIISDFLQSSSKCIIPISDYSFGQLVDMLKKYHDASNVLVVNKEEVLKSQTEALKLIEIFKDKLN